MKVIGIAGGIASGKSLVASCFASLGAVVIDADRLGHLVLEEAGVQRQIRELWGESVFDDQGRVDRAAVAKIVFAEPPEGPRQLALLERITHPRIELRLNKEFERLEREQAPAVIIDAPVMFKAGWDRFCDALVFVDAPRPVRLARAKRRGWTDEHFRRRERSQMPLEAKRKRCDYVLDNARDEPERLAGQVGKIWVELVIRNGVGGV